MPRLPSTIAIVSFSSVLRFSAEPPAPAAKTGNPAPQATSRSSATGTVRAAHASGPRRT